MKVILKFDLEALNSNEKTGTEWNAPLLLIPLESITMLDAGRKQVVIRHGKGYILQIQCPNFVEHFPAVVRDLLTALQEYSDLDRFLICDVNRRVREKAAKRATDHQKFDSEIVK